MENYNLSIQDLTKSFKIGGMIFGTNIVAVDHVNLDIHSDKPWIMAIVGESGSGKSTLAKMVLKLLEAGSGNISLGRNQVKRRGCQKNPGNPCRGGA